QASLMILFRSMPNTYSGITVRFRPEQVFDLLRNECSTCPGIRIIGFILIFWLRLMLIMNQTVTRYRDL
ncbi:MAG: hypothetical protein ACLPX5_12880, partial [Dissulfurispiraceae bacterium]